MSDLPLPPGKFGLPLIGDTINFLTDPEFARKRYQQYGSIFKTILFGKPTIFLYGPEANLFVLTNENKYFVSTFPPSTKALLGPRSLSSQTGLEHQNRRKLLYQAFQPRALASYTDVMEEITQRYLHKWLQMGRLTWYPEIRSYTFDIAAKLFVGLDFASQTPLCKLFETWCEGLFTIPLSLPWTKFGRAEKARKLLLIELGNIIQKRQQAPGLGEDALSMLIAAKDEAGNSLSLEELKDQILLLLFAGHETLTSAIASMCLQLAKHPEILSKVYAEQQQFPTNQPITIEQLKQMSYLEQVMKEVMRLVPPVGSGFRKVINTCEFNGYQIPEGWNVLYQINQTHQDSQTYPEPKKFDPERFNPEKLTNAQPFGYVPFGGGLRECIGKEFARVEMKLFAARIIRQCAWELLPNQDLTLITVPVPHPRDGLQVKIFPRI